MGILLLRTVLVYFLVFAVMRIMGKREIGKLSVLDLVISIMIAEIAVFVIEDVRKPMSDGIVPIVTLVAIQVGMALLALRFQRIRYWMDGKPSFLIRGGKLDRAEMSRQRYNLDDLLLQLRQNRVTNVADVEFAILEPSGKLTVIEKKGDKGRAGTERAREGTAAERSKGKGAETFRYEGLPLPLIMDGKVQDDNLQQLGQTRFWLKNRLQEKGVYDFKDVFFCSVDHRGELFLDKKNK
ncbi:UPF0702 transmembrane protein YrbG [Paenibacillus sp. J31TS4]|uniref:DUF421 domain-containing protein n=1 Tax=Paenibacillus sp. J31TS4 TaxID=2807195 RepID=UPI001B01E774|nr:DUF421 domain-containing protein [Paenibacillus sp. J31TS4]GIP39228.1 UPF0702 transmembrane protein YrbG [Paenibacillus sp. J31TS4]